MFGNIYLQATRWITRLKIVITLTWCFAGVCQLKQSIQTIPERPFFKACAFVFFCTHPSESAGVWLDGCVHRPTYLFWFILMIFMLCRFKRLLPKFHPVQQSKSLPEVMSVILTQRLVRCPRQSEEYSALKSIFSWKVSIKVQA